MLKIIGFIRVVGLRGRSNMGSVPMFFLCFSMFLMAKHARLFEGFKDNMEKYKAKQRELAEAIGFLVIKFNRLDRDLGELIEHVIMGVPVGNKIAQLHEIFTGGLSFAQKINFLKALWYQRFVSDHKKLGLCDTFIKNCSEIEDFRNMVVHSCWGLRAFGSFDFVRIKSHVRSKKGLHVKMESAENLSKDITKKCGNLDALKHQIIEFYIALAPTDKTK